MWKSLITISFLNNSASGITHPFITENGGGVLIREFTAREGRTNNICLPWTQSSLNTPGILSVYSYSQESNTWGDIFELFVGNGTDIVEIKAPTERWNSEKCRASTDKH